ncbi:PqqD family protein [Streptomyces inhibens]|uniref:PqqD family protein n=1 Tax=Streptomyces inhibens TaxID=2293571 RepID=UPI0037B01AE4
MSRSGAAILRALDGTATGREFAARTVSRGSDAASTERIVLAFLGELRAVGLLTVPPASDRHRPRCGSPGVAICRGGH